MTGGVHGESLRLAVHLCMMCATEELEILERETNLGPVYIFGCHEYFMMHNFPRSNHTGFETSLAQALLCLHIFSAAILPCLGFVKALRIFFHVVK